MPLQGLHVEIFRQADAHTQVGTLRCVMRVPTRSQRATNPGDMYAKLATFHAR